MLFSDNSQARIQFQPQVERSVTACLRMSHLSQLPGQTIWIMEQSHFVYVIHPGVNPLWQACRNMKNSFNVAPAMSAPKMAGWPRPNGLKFFWLIGKIRPKTNNIAQVAPKRCSGCVTTFF